MGILLENYDGNDDTNDSLGREKKNCRERERKEDLHSLKQVRGKGCLSAETGSSSRTLIHGNGREADYLRTFASRQVKTW